MRTAVAGASFAALAVVAGAPSGAVAEQVRIVHLDCEQWRARQAMLAERAAYRAAHPVRQPQRAGHTFRRHGPRIHFVCDCQEEGAEAGLGGGSLPASNGSGGGVDLAQFSGGGGSGFGYGIGGGGGSLISGGGGGSSGGSPFDPFGPVVPPGPGPFPPGPGPFPPDPGPIPPDPGPFPPGPIPSAPEPSTWVLLGLGAALLAVLKLRRRETVGAAARSLARPKR